MLKVWKSNNYAIDQVSFIFFKFNCHQSVSHFQSQKFCLKICEGVNARQKDTFVAILCANPIEGHKMLFISAFDANHHSFEVTLWSKFTQSTQFQLHALITYVFRTIHADCQQQNDNNYGFKTEVVIDIEFLKNFSVFFCIHFYLGK